MKSFTSKHMNQGLDLTNSNASVGALKRYERNIYLYNLLSDLSGLVNIQSVFSVSNDRIQRPPFTEAAMKERGGGD